MNELNNDMYYFETVDMIPAEIYYHYTSLDALYSIVTSRTFRLTSLKSSNDKKELSYKPDEFLDDFDNLCANENDDDARRYLHTIRKSIDLNKESFLKMCKEKTYPYALCLSKKKDNLTHWDRYASNCMGVCIGFNVSALRVLMQRMDITAFGVGVYDIGIVLYSSSKREMFIKNAIVKILNALVKQEKINSNNTLNIFQNSGYVYAASDYLQVAKFVKNDSFVDEDEVRLYHDANSIQSTLRLMESMEDSIETELYKNLKRDFIEYVKSLRLKDENFCISSRGIRSYKNLCLEEVWGQGVIPEIILGPMCIQNKAELRRFLNANGLQGTKISISKVPIR